MKINGVELDFRLYSAEQVEMADRYRKGLKEFKDLKDHLPEDGIEKCRFVCDKIKSFFDDVFGEGAGAKVCGSGSDLLYCVDAYSRLVDEQIAQDEQFKAMIERMSTLNAHE